MCGAGPFGRPRTCRCGAAGAAPALLGRSSVLLGHGALREPRTRVLRTAHILARTSPLQYRCRASEASWASDFVWCGTSCETPAPATAVPRGPHPPCWAAVASCSGLGSPARSEPVSCVCSHFGSDQPPSVPVPSLGSRMGSRFLWCGTSCEIPHLPLRCRGGRTRLLGRSSKPAVLIYIELKLILLVLVRGPLEPLTCYCGAAGAAPAVLGRSSNLCADLCRVDS
jgi:hypothetical protein